MRDRIAIAQLNFTVGDMAGNAERIRRARAENHGAALLVCPELAICGYPPEDLVLRPGFVQACMREVAALAEETKDGGCALILGSPWGQEGWVYNAALLLAEGAIRHIQPKRMLPNYGVFDEKRVFTPGEASRVVRFQGVTLGLMVCEDMWYPHVSADLAKAGAELLIVLNASPFESGKLAHRHAVAAEHARGLPLVYANMVGGQDDIIFDGGSFALNAQGRVAHQLPEFLEVAAMAQTYGPTPPLAHEESVWRALTLALGDYVRKNNFPGVLLGLSGGIDSAVVATLAADALGAQQVLGVLLPSQHTSQESNADALALAAQLGISTLTLPIAGSVAALGDALAPVMPAAAPGFADWRESLAVGGNLQARARGVLLMALSNATGRMLLNTGNKSEVAVGYTTLYGDSCGGYAVLKDIYKTQVYALAKWRNRQGAAIPERSLTRAPTAELAPGQKDEDQLPPYAMLDAVLVRLIEGRRSIPEIIADGYAPELVEKIAGMLRTNEYKRRQMPPGAKVSPMLFGRDWRYPLTNRFRG